MRRLLLVFPILMTLALLAPCPALARDWRPVSDFYWEKLGREEFPGLIKTHGNLRGTADPERESRNVHGLLKYRFEVAQTGWHVLEYDGFPQAWNNPEVAFDNEGVDGSYLVHQGPDPKTAARVWLTKGQHTLTLKRNHYQGFPGITRWRVRPADPRNPLDSFSVERARPTNVFAQREEIAFKATCGGPQQTAISAELIDSANGKVVQRKAMDCPAGPGPQTLEVAFRAERGAWAPGLHEVRFGPAGARPAETIRFGNLWIADESPVSAAATPNPKKTLVREITCADPSRPPDYSNRGAPAGPGTTSFTIPGLGRFLATGPRGWQRTAGGKDDPSFFAYDVDGLEPGKPYLIEFDYPDDAYRTFVVVAFDKGSKSLAAGGADTGWDHPLGNTLQTGQFLHWARSSKIQLAVINVYGDAKPAAIQALRVHSLPGGLGALAKPGKDSRRFASWFEEGVTLANVYGVHADDNRGPATWQSALSNWIRTSLQQGVTTLVPTVSVYDTIYPSNFHDWDTTHQTHDVVKHMLLESARHGLEVIPEFHPKAGRLKWWTVRPPAQNDNALYDNEGKPASGPTEPAFNPLHPASREWLTGMLREFLQRYKGHPNMPGISLRFMGWFDPGLWSYGGSTWRDAEALREQPDTFGYDDLTISRFAAETGTRMAIGVSADSPDRFRARHEFIMKDPGRRQAFENWKCDKVREIVAEIRKLMDQEAPGLTLYLHMAGIGPNSYGRSGGFDPARLGSIPGVELINGAYTYGRRGWESRVRQQVGRERLADPGWLRLTTLSGRGSRYIASHSYMECRPEWLPYDELGWPECKDRNKCPRPMLSAPVNPAGRNALERYAVQLAEGDAAMLGDGGNSLVWNQPVARDFIRRYLGLPNRPFETVKDAAGREVVDPVAVRRLKTASGTLIYAVNREPYPLEASIRFKNVRGGGARDLLDEARIIPLEGDSLTIALDAYELRTFVVPDAPGWEIDGAKAVVPEQRLGELDAQIAWHERLLQGRCAGDACLKSPVYGPVARRIQQARTARGEGRIWAARTAFEFLDVNESMERLNERSPHMRKMGDEPGAK